MKAYVMTDLAIWDFSDNKANIEFKVNQIINAINLTYMMQTQMMTPSTDEE